MSENVVKFRGRRIVPRGDQPRCETCRFWQVDAEDDRSPGEIGACHRYPPRFLPDSHLADSIDGTTSAFTGFFPETMAGEWCGEWQLVRAAEG